MDLTGAYPTGRLHNHVLPASTPRSRLHLTPLRLKRPSAVSLPVTRSKPIIWRKDASCCDFFSRYSHLLSSPAFSQTAATQKERHFTFDYKFTVKNIGPGCYRVRVYGFHWPTRPFQDVKVVAKSGDLPLKELDSPTPATSPLYAESPKADKSEYAFTVKYDVVRREHVVLVNRKPSQERPSQARPPRRFRTSI